PRFKLDHARTLARTRCHRRGVGRKDVGRPQSLLDFGQAARRTAVRNLCKFSRRTASGPEGSSAQSILCCAAGPPGRGWVRSSRNLSLVRAKGRGQGAKVRFKVRMFTVAPLTFVLPSRLPFAPCPNGLLCRMSL